VVGRYDHVSKAQETGKAIREMWHKTDLYAEEFDPEKIKMPFRPWIFENDAEKVAIEKVPSPQTPAGLFLLRFGDRGIDE